MAARIVQLPDPCLVVLVGAAGAGKSTFARRHFEPSEVLSGDTFRGIVGRSEADQAASGRAFAILHRELERRLGRGRLTVVDATNLRADARRTLLVRAARAGVPAVAIVLDPPAEVVRERAAQRLERSVPDAIVERHLAELAALLASGRLEREGFAAIHRLGGPGAPDDAADAEVSRHPRQAPRPT